MTLHEDPALLDDPQWQLFDVVLDPAETRDVAAAYPEKVAELAAAWDQAAWHNTVFPLLSGPDMGRRRPEEAKLGEPVGLLARGDRVRNGIRTG